MYKQRLFQVMRCFIVLCSIAASYFLLKYIITFFYPILLACLFSLLLHPIVTFMERKLRFPRSFATVVILVMMFIFVIGSSFLLFTELFQSSAYLAEKVPAHFQTLIHFGEEMLNTKILPLYQKIVSFFHTLDASQQTTINEHIKQMTDHIASTGAGMLQDGLLKIPAILAMLPSSLTVFIFIILATFLITNDFPKLQQATANFFPDSAKTTTVNIIIQLKKAFTAFIRAQLILILITACIIFFGLSILRIDHVLTITLIAFIMDLLPYIGTGIIFIPWIIYLFITGDYSMTIGLSILYMSIIISRQILEPKILSSNMGIHPLAALISLFIGIQLWGLLGIVIAPISLIFLLAFYQAGIMKRIGIFIKGA